MSKKIVLKLPNKYTFEEVIEKYKDYIMEQTLAVNIVFEKLDCDPVTIILEKENNV